MAQHTRCFNCKTDGVSIFYEIDDIPVHSVLLMPTKEKAVSYPRGDLKLGFCGACGFVQNCVFDPGVHEYSTSYEETQGFSAVFSTFAASPGQIYFSVAMMAAEFTNLNNNARRAFLRTTNGGEKPTRIART